MTIEHQEETIERAFLLGVHLGKSDPMQDTDEESLEELGRLLETAGAEVIGSALQNRDAVDAKTYIGEGKLEEVLDFCRNNGGNLLVFDDELSGSQMRNIEEFTGIKTIDRSRLILDIFARHANSRESKCQVELAQLQYMLPRLSGMGHSLSRLGGGIGTRGPGESKLEADRRHIKSRITSLTRELGQIKRHRENMRKKRQKEEIPVVAIVGYTNAGKSSLLNRLTDAGTLAEDQLFATLDTLVRYKKVNDLFEMLLVDTVGFIRKLPHHLVDAFRSTLEEATYADLLIHLVDAGSLYREEQEKMVGQLLEEIGAGSKPQILVYNKIDTVKRLPEGHKDAVMISCTTGEGIDLLLDAVQHTLPPQKREITILLPYSSAGLLSEIYAGGSIQEEEYREDGIFVRCIVDPALYAKVRPYLSEEK